MREPYKPSVLTMGLYVPAEGSPALSIVKKGSAIVGVPSEDGHIRCYYEGGVFQPNSFSEYLASAAGRLAERYPTVARCYPKTGDVVQVGTIRWDSVLSGWVIDELSDEAALRAWTDDVPEIGGTREQKERAVGIAFSSGSNTEVIIAYQTAVSAKADPVEAVLNLLRKREAPVSA